MMMMMMMAMQQVVHTAVWLLGVRHVQQGQRQQKKGRSKTRQAAVYDDREENMPPDECCTQETEIDEDTEENATQASGLH